MQHEAIKSITVRGLHHYLDLSLSFNQGLNVIYGKNGKGKTTALHILANILELDITRFRHLQFSHIKVENFNSNTIELIKDPTGRIRIFLDGNEAGSYETDSMIPDISPVETNAIRSAFGGRPVYLPAFRAILERVKPSPYGDPNRDESFEGIKKSEIAALRESGVASNSRTRSWNATEQTAASIARKTIQCREWFGQFVPTIRYPSLAEVSDSITSEFMEAQAEVSHSERKMLSSMFVSVFRSLVSSDDTPSDGEVEPLMQRVRECLEIEEDSSHYPDHIGLQLATELYKASGNQEQSAAQRRVLKLYAEMLESRKHERTESFYKVKKFEDAVNLFLDGKSLHVNDNWRGSNGRFRESVYIETENGRQYPLTSLSSGERQILTMLFSATRMSKTASGVFLIDEPELSLHVDWQRIILGTLNSQAVNRQIIACTHSPEVGADHSDAVQMFSPSISNPELPQPESDDGSFIMDDNV